MCELLALAECCVEAVGRHGRETVAIKNGLISGALCWFGFVATTLSVNYAFGGRATSLTIIDGGHWLGVLLLMGAVIGAFGS